jgi:hypothetical protein
MEPEPMHPLQRKSNLIKKFLISYQLSEEIPQGV